MNTSTITSRKQRATFKPPLMKIEVDKIHNAYVDTKLNQINKDIRKLNISREEIMSEKPRVK